MGILFRSAERKDCQKIAELINIASDGVVDYLFHDLVPGMTPVQVVAHNLENDNYPHSYRSTVVAEEETEVIAMALSYPSAHHKITDEMKPFFPGDRLAHLRHFYAARIENSWFLDALGVFEHHRRRGIGGKLIARVKATAVENGYHTLSLIVFADNRPAIQLYERNGFEVAQRVALQANEYIKHAEGCWLMKCEIGS